MEAVVPVTWWNSSKQSIVNYWTMPKKTMVTDETNIALLQKDVGYIKESVQRIEGTLEGNYVTRIEFEPIKKVVYGLVALILVAVVGAVIALVVKKP